MLVGLVTGLVRTGQDWSGLVRTGQDLVRILARILARIRVDIGAYALQGLMFFESQEGRHNRQMLCILFLGFHQIQAQWLDIGDIGLDTGRDTRDTGLDTD